jgi:ABC-type hemin transport system substrate-binding protein
MGQPTSACRPCVPLLALASCLTLAAASCDRGNSGNTGAPTTGRKVASLSPAATEMLVGMGAGDRVVAVSNFESSPHVKALPRVGDYQSTDWEALARLRPDVMVIQMAADRVPPGLKERAARLRIELVNVRIDRLEDVFDTMQQLGAVAGERDKGRDGTRALRERLDRLKAEHAGKPPVRVLIVRDENATEVIGPDNFLDDLLTVVNATNAAEELGKAYPTVDREKLAALAPEAVVVLLPDAKPQSIASVRRVFASLPDVPAVKNRRVSVISDPYALVPGARLADLAQRIADELRPPPAPRTTTAPSTRPATVTP